MRVGVGDLRREPFAAHDHGEAVFACHACLDLHPRQAYLIEPFHKRRRLLGRDAARTTVDDTAFRVKGAQVSASGDVAGRNLHADAQGL